METTNADRAMIDDELVSLKKFIESEMEKGECNNLIFRYIYDLNDGDVFYSIKLNEIISTRVVIPENADIQFETETLAYSFDESIGEYRNELSHCDNVYCIGDSGETKELFDKVVGAMMRYNEIVNRLKRDRCNDREADRQEVLDKLTEHLNRQTSEDLEKDYNELAEFNKEGCMVSSDVGSEISISVVGNRTFDDYGLLKETLTKVISDKEKEHITVKNFVSGGARGADSLCERFAVENGIPITIYPADWKRYGKSAGFIRNETMIRNCGLCVAFWDGKSHGTKHDIELCEKYGKECLIFYF